MDNKEILDLFLIQSSEGDLKTAHFPKEFEGLGMKVSFGMGAPAKIPWIAFIAPEMKVSKGFYPVYLYYKELKILILAYEISETESFGETWPPEIMNSSDTISAYFDRKVPRYGDSFVFKAYEISVINREVIYSSPTDGKILSKQDLEQDLNTLINYYKNLVSIEVSSPESSINKGIFYMEKELENFLIRNWNETELGKRYSLIIEEGELVSQQYPTEIGKIDLLVKDKFNGNYVVIELKRNQTSDDTIGQLARYMGWIIKNKKDFNVKGIIIAGQYDKKLDYALESIPNVDVFVYEVDFNLRKFRKI